MKILLNKLAIIGLAAGALVASGLQDFMNTDPQTSLQSAMQSAANHIHYSIQEEEAQNNPFVHTDECLLDQFADDNDAIPHRLSPEELAAQAKAYLESDKAILERTSNLIEWVKEKAEKVDSTLKTPKGHNTLKAMAEAFQVTTDDVEAFVVKCDKKMPKCYPTHTVATIFHLRLEAAFSAASAALFRHITAGVLVGSSDEQADLEILLASFKCIAPCFYDFFENDMFYSAVRRHYAQCYDLVPTGDFVSRFKIASKVGSVSKLAFDTSSDGDNFEINHCVLGVAEHYLTSLRLWFIDKTSKKSRELFFDSQITFQRLQTFLAQSPDVFNFCQSRTNAAIDTDLTAQHWKRWVYVGGKDKYKKSNTLFGSQVILISPNDCVAVRLRKNISSVGFLAPYSPAKHSTYPDFLYDRPTESLKHSRHQGIDLVIPAARPETGLTPYWVVPSMSLVDAVMADAHF